MLKDISNFSLFFIIKILSSFYSGTQALRLMT
jgi:hypothetical protein